MTQTWALILDAYRDLNSRKMFWIVLVISGLVAAIFAALGINQQGITIFGHLMRLESYNLKHITAQDFYNQWFVSLGIQLWITWGATILGLISTASLFPEFLSGGTIDLYLSKPISRLRLFLTKYISGLIFLAMQIFGFIFASFLVIGIRGGVWEFGLFYSVPIVLLFYSYLFCISALLGTWTRSTIATVLLTLLAWLIIFGVHSTERALLGFRLDDLAEASALDQQIASQKSALDQLQSADPPSTQQSAAFWRKLVPGQKPGTENDWRKQTLQDQIARAQAERKFHTDSYRVWHEVFYDVMTCLPKTSETVDLLDRVLYERAGLKALAAATQPSDDDETRGYQQSMLTEYRVRKELSSRSIMWVVGTSVGFECFLLAIAVWMFCRRDY